MLKIELHQLALRQLGKLSKTLVYTEKVKEEEQCTQTENTLFVGYSGYSENFL